MELKEIADLFITAVGKVEFYWNFYTVTLLALIGWLISTKMVLGFRLKLLITVGYLFFVLMNLIGLWGSYSFAEALRLDLLEAAKNIPCKLNKVANAQKLLSQQRSFDFQMTLAIIIHFILAILILSVVWFGLLKQNGDDNLKQNGNNKAA